MGRMRLRDGMMCSTERGRWRCCRSWRVGRLRWGRELWRGTGARTSTLISSARHLYCRRHDPPHSRACRERMSPPLPHGSAQEVKQTSAIFLRADIRPTIAGMGTQAVNSPAGLEIAIASHARPDGRRFRAYDRRPERRLYGYKWV